MTLLPNAERATTEPTKLRDYLLSRTHPIGRYKAAVFAALGYTQDEWRVLQDDLMEMVRSNPARPGQTNPHGLKYEVSGILKGPFGRCGPLVSVWLVGPDEGVPRLITVFPG